jgi:hypothetical protein
MLPVVVQVPDVWATERTDVLIASPIARKALDASMGVFEN